MNRLVVCMGNYAKLPYRINYIKMDVYCIEEFCYYLCEYTNLLDQDLFDEKLIDWIKEQCDLPKLALLLQESMGRPEELSVFVGTILRYVQFADEDRIKEIEQALRQSDGLTPLERKKQRADNLIQEKKYYFGLDLYHELLREIPETDEVLLAKVLYNCGVSYANLFYFETALDMFERALEIRDDTRIKKACLYCRRNLLTKDAYIQYLTEHPELCQDSLQLEKELQGLKVKWQTTEEKEELNLLSGGKEMLDREEYQIRFHKKLDAWENEYTTMVRLK